MAANNVLQYLSLTLLGINLLVSGLFVLGERDHAEPAVPEAIGDIVLLEPAPAASDQPAEPAAQTSQQAASAIGQEEAPAAAQPEPPVAMAEPQPAEPAPVVEEVYTQCYKLGPLHNEVDTKALMDELKQANINSVIFSQQPGEVLGYWVHLPPERSRALGRLKVEELKTKGIQDIMLVIKGEPQYAISLGVFRNKLTAQKRQRHIRRLGYPAQLILRYKQKPETWLLAETDNKTEPTEDGWKVLLQNFPGVKYEKSGC